MKGDELGCRLAHMNQSQNEVEEMFEMECLTGSSERFRQLEVSDRRDECSSSRLQLGSQHVRTCWDGGKLEGTLIRLRGRRHLDGTIQELESESTARKLGSTTRQVVESKKFEKKVFDNTREELET